MKYLICILFLICFKKCLCHLFIVDNEIKIEKFLYGGEELDKLQLPLQEINGKNVELKNEEEWICHGYKNNSNKEIKNIIIGKNYKLGIGCAGGSAKNKYKCLNNYSTFHLEKQSKPRGCILSVAKKIGVNNFNVIGIDKNCPDPKSSKSSIFINNNIEECINCICSWTWIPSIKYSGSEVRKKNVVQSYMNCFNCNIIYNYTNSYSKNNYNKQLLFYNVPKGIYTKENEEVIDYYKEIQKTIYTNNSTNIKIIIFYNLFSLLLYFLFF